MEIRCWLDEKPTEGLAWFRNAGPGADNRCAASTKITSQYQPCGQQIFSVRLQIDPDVSQTV